MSNKRKRMLRDKKILFAKRMIAENEKKEREFLEAVSFIRELDAIAAGEPVAFLVRVSTETQKIDGSLVRQEKEVSSKITERGGRPKLFWKGVMAGDSEEWFRVLESTFSKIDDLAITKVVFSELSRLVRSPDFKKGDTNAKPSPEQLKPIELLAEQHGLTVICIWPPDSPFSNERSYQTKRSGSCGRPKGSRNSKPINSKPISCKERRDQLMPLVFHVHDPGNSYRKTARIVNETVREAGYLTREICHETVRQWILRRDGKKLD
jgi:hypothetical protein